MEKNLDYIYKMREKCVCVYETWEKKSGSEVLIISALRNVCYSLVPRCSWQTSVYSLCLFLIFLRHFFVIIKKKSMNISSTKKVNIAPENTIFYSFHVSCGTILFSVYLCKSVFPWIWQPAAALFRGSLPYVSHVIPKITHWNYNLDFIVQVIFL